MHDAFVAGVLSFSDKAGQIQRSIGSDGEVVGLYVYVLAKPLMALNASATSDGRLNSQEISRLLDPAELRYTASEVFTAMDVVGAIDPTQS